MKDLIIAQKEAIAWKEGAMKTLEASRKEEINYKPLFLIDSQVLVHAINKGASGDEFINKTIMDVNTSYFEAGMVYSVKWISTDFMKIAGADKLSRFVDDDEIQLAHRLTERGVRWLNRNCGPFFYCVFSSVYDNCSQFNIRYASFHFAEDPKFLKFDPFEFIRNRKFSRKTIIFPPPDLANDVTHLLIDKVSGFVSKVEVVCVLPEINIRRLKVHFSSRPGFSTRILSFHVPNVSPKFKLISPKPNQPWFVIKIRLDT